MYRADRRVSGLCLGEVALQMHAALQVDVVMPDRPVRLTQKMAASIMRSIPLKQTYSCTRQFMNRSKPDDQVSCICGPQSVSFQAELTAANPCDVCMTVFSATVMTLLQTYPNATRTRQTP